ncbi:MAG TPA: RNA polymerase sigma factor [bacterium]|nr:RNA polymerase sigma factor [bacterium]
MSSQPPQDAPHLSPASWGKLIDSLDAATIFVVISSWLGADARAELSVEDLWQETLWMAWRDRDQHQWVNLTRYRAWLLGIARNRLHDLLRSARRSKRGGHVRTARFSDIGGSDTVGGVLPPQSTTPSRMMSHMERARTLERALNSLPPELRELVRLRMFEELSTREAAERLGIPLSTAKHRLVRGLQAYRDALGKDFDIGVRGVQQP